MERSAAEAERLGRSLRTLVAAGGQSARCGLLCMYSLVHHVLQPLAADLALFSDAAPAYLEQRATYIFPAFRIEVTELEAFALTVDALLGEPIASEQLIGSNSSGCIWHDRNTPHEPSTQTAFMWSGWTAATNRCRSSVVGQGIGSWAPFLQSLHMEQLRIAIEAWDIAQHYDVLIVTRLDYLFLAPHPSLPVGPMDVFIPRDHKYANECADPQRCELNDRHLVLPIGLAQTVLRQFHFIFRVYGGLSAACGVVSNPEALRTAILRSIRGVHVHTFTLLGFIAKGPGPKDNGHHALTAARVESPDKPGTTLAGCPLLAPLLEMAAHGYLAKFTSARVDTTHGENGTALRHPPSEVVGMCKLWDACERSGHCKEWREVDTANLTHVLRESGFRAALAMSGPQAAPLTADALTSGRRPDSILRAHLPLPLRLPEAAHYDAPPSPPPPPAPPSPPPPPTPTLAWRLNRFLGYPLSCGVRGVCRLLGPLGREQPGGQASPAELELDRRRKELLADVEAAQTRGRRLLDTRDTRQQALRRLTNGSEHQCDRWAVAYTESCSAPLLNRLRATVMETLESRLCVVIVLGGRTPSPNRALELEYLGGRGLGNKSQVASGGSNAAAPASTVNASSTLQATRRVEPVFRRPATTPMACAGFSAADEPRVVLLRPERQLVLPFATVSVLPWTSGAARRNLGYLYAVAMGARQIFDADATQQRDLSSHPAASMVPPHAFCTALLLPSTPMAPGVAETLRSLWAARLAHPRRAEGVWGRAPGSPHWAAAFQHVRTRPHATVMELQWGYAYERMWHYLDQPDEILGLPRRTGIDEPGADCHALLGLFHRFYAAGALNWHDVLIATAWVRDLEELHHQNRHQRNKE